MPDTIDTIDTMPAVGWRTEYSPTTDCWRLVHDANKWSTNLYYHLADAIKAAAALQAGAETTMERRAATVEGLRKALR